MAMKVKIGAAEVQVNMHESVVSNGEAIFGQFDQEGSRRAVQLSDCETVTDMDVLDTLIHELLHAIGSVYGMRENHEHIHIYATALAQALTSGKLVDATKLRAKLRATCSTGKDLVSTVFPSGSRV